MKALVFNNIVQEVTETEFEVHESFVWMDCSDDCIAGWLLENGALTAPAPLPERDYIFKRRQEYPSIVDYIDGVVKDDQTQIDKYIADCEAVKAQFPKPE